MGLVLDDDLLAVVAHSLLNSLSVVSGSAETLAERWPVLDAADRDLLLDRILVQSEHIAAVLSDLVRSGRPEVADALHQLEQTVPAEDRRR